MACPRPCILAAIPRANLRKYFMAAAALAQPDRRKLEPSRTRLSTPDRSGDACHFLNLVRGGMDLALVFAFAQTASCHRQDHGARSHETGQETEAPPAGRLFQLIGSSPGRFEKAFRSRRGTAPAP